MFIKLNVTHTFSGNFGFTSTQSSSTEHINFDHVSRFYRKENNDFTTIRFEDGKLIGVSESTDEILAKLQ